MFVGASYINNRASGTSFRARSWGGLFLLYKSATPKRKKPLPSLLLRSVEAYRNVVEADYLFLKDEPATPGVTGRFPFNKEANISMDGVYAKSMSGTLLAQLNYEVHGCTNVT